MAELPEVSIVRSGDGWALRGLADDEQQFAYRVDAEEAALARARRFGRSVIVLVEDIDGRMGVLAQYPLPPTT